MAKKKNPKLTVVDNDFDGTTAVYLDGQRELCSDEYTDYGRVLAEGEIIQEIVGLLGGECKVIYAHADWCAHLNPDGAENGDYYPMDLKDVVLAGTPWNAPVDKEKQEKKDKLSKEAKELQDQLHRKLNELGELEKKK